MKRLEVMKLDSRAKLPTQFHPGDVGIDLHTLDNYRIEYKDGVVLIRTGIAVSIPEGYEGEIRPRSSTWNRNTSAWHVHHGTIDSGYRGEIKVGVSRIREGYGWINDGERVAQLCIRKVPKVTIKEVSTLSDSDRGTKGFGSTG